MTPKEKAKELTDKYIKYTPVKFDFENAKQCALIAVYEILNIDNIKTYILHKEIIKYYIEVKKEIQNL